MKIFPMSDIHSNFLNSEKAWNWHKTETIKEMFTPIINQGVDVICAAGDIGDRCLGASMLSKILQVFPNLHIVYALGNHEHYGANMEVLYSDLKYISDTTERLHIFDNTYNFSFVINDVAFIGATLWTDYNKESDNTINAVQRGMNDYNYIFAGGANKLLTPNRILNEHYTQKKQIFRQLQKHGEAGRKTVVVTHHVPHLPSRPITDMLSYGYNVDLTVELDLCEHLPVYWISGHTHQSHFTEKSYQNGSMISVSNQYGYSTEGCTGWSTECILEV